MSMIEHAVGVVSLDGFVEISHMDHDEMGSLLLDTMAENAKLREELADAPKCDACEAMLDCDECLRADGSHKERRRLSAENTKLRELVRALLTCATEGECDECRMNGATPWHVGNAQLCDGVWEHLRELGIEVDG